GALAPVHVPADGAFGLVRRAARAGPERRVADQGIGPARAAPVGRGAAGLALARGRGAQDRPAGLQDPGQPGDPGSGGVGGGTPGPLGPGMAATPAEPDRPPPGG